MAKEPAAADADTDRRGTRSQSASYDAEPRPLEVAVDHVPRHRRCHGRPVGQSRRGMKMTLEQMIEHQKRITEAINGMTGYTAEAQPFEPGDTPEVYIETSDGDYLYIVIGTM